MPPRGLATMRLVGSHRRTKPSHLKHSATPSSRIRCVSIRQCNILTIIQQPNFITFNQSHIPTPSLNSTINMSSVLSLQIAHALFPFLRSSSSPDNKNDFNEKFQSTHESTSRIRIERAENLELRPLLSEMSRPAARHRRSSSTSTSSMSDCNYRNRQSLEATAALPHVALASMRPR